MYQQIEKMIRAARGQYEQALLRIDDKARNGAASGALSQADLRRLRTEAWGYGDEHPVAFIDLGIDQAAAPVPMPAEAESSTQANAEPQARAVAEGEDLA